MKFSISTSFYNRGHLVENLYKQILAQTHTDWEWIVTDDFSEYNNAEEILRKICSKDERVKYYNQTRKKECFYNPQRGCTGDIVIQFDSDDYAYPQLLSIYNELFLKHSDVIGISCTSYTVGPNDEFVEIQGGGTYYFEDFPKFNFTPMGRAWRNVIREFDNGKLEYYQNDTNIVRHVENIGKWLYYPRVLYKYYYSTDTFSRLPGRTNEEFARIENERLFIESKFPHLDNPDKVTTSLYYLPIMEQARAFTVGDFNISTTRNKILYVKDDIKPYERQLLKELFFDHDLYFDYNLDIKFDEIIISLDDPLVPKLQEIRDTLYKTNVTTLVKLRYDLRHNYINDEIIGTVQDVFGGIGWRGCGYELYLNSAI
jgi:glycosyltransferase involved in cell wall biosynthesis